MDIYTLILGLGAIGGAIVGILSYLRTIPISTKTLRQKCHDLEDLAKLNKTEATKWKNRYNNESQMIQTNKDYDLDSTKGIADLAGDIIPKFSKHLPPEIQEAIGDPQTLNALLQLYAKHKDKIQPLLKSFIGKVGGPKKGESTQNENVEAV